MASQPAAVNHWPERRCAKAFWNQREVPPYQKLLRDTVARLDPQPGQRWIDLGCGSGQLTRALWQKSAGTLSGIVALDCAAANEKSIAKLRESLSPPPSPSQMRFVHADFSAGLAQFDERAFDGAVSGLAIQYAESWSEALGCWTTAAYDHLLREVCRILRPGGTFVFSVNVPEPSWLKVGLCSVPGFFCTTRPLRYVRNALRMLRYGAWLKREARRGRFHYLPAEVVARKLHKAGFGEVEHRFSFAGQALIVHCRRLAVPLGALSPGARSA
jgi:ubiquinone/menaquinone biosynthesis C-methylase UbiE